MTHYKTGDWVVIGSLGELRKALSMFHDSISCEIEVRLLETVDDAGDGSSELSIQFRETEIGV